MRAAFCGDLEFVVLCEPAVVLIYKVKFLQTTTCHEHLLTSPEKQLQLFSFLLQHFLSSRLFCVSSITAAALVLIATIECHSLHSWTEVNIRPAAGDITNSHRKLQLLMSRMLQRISK